MYSHNLLIFLGFLSTTLASAVFLVRPGNGMPLQYRSTVVPPSPGRLPSVVLVPAILAPAPENSEDIRDNGRSDSNNTSESDSEPKKPRCLTSLFTWYAKKKVVGALENFNAPDLPDFRAPPGSGLQGGIVSPGGVSQLTPDLTQANNALKDAQLMENQVNLAQAQLNANLAGVPNSGIPLSPGLLRGESDSDGVATPESTAFAQSTVDDYGVTTQAQVHQYYPGSQRYLPDVMYSQPGAYFYS